MLLVSRTRLSSSFACKKTEVVIGRRCQSAAVESVSVTHVSRYLVGRGDAAEDEGVAVLARRRPRLAHALQQLPHAAVLPLLDEPVARTHVHRLGLQLEVLEWGGGRWQVCGEGEEGLEEKGEHEEEVEKKNKEKGDDSNDNYNVIITTNLRINFSTYIVAGTNTKQSSFEALFLHL